MKISKMANTSNTTTTTTTTRSLSAHRIRTIMKSSSEAENVGEAAIKMMCKATEMFLQKLTRDGHRLMKRGEKELDYKHLAEAVRRRKIYEFVLDMMPKKITMRRFKELDARRANNSSDEEFEMDSEEEEQQESEDEDDDGVKKEDEEEGEEEEEESSSSGEESGSG